MGTEVRCGGLLFTSKFDSGNLASVEKVDRSDSDSDGVTNDPYGIRVIPDYEFNVWTKPDCCGTQFENGNRSWFYFGIRGNNPNKVIKINIVNLNRQGKLYSQGMAPLVKVLPSRPKWERIRDRATYQMIDGQFTLSFTYRFSEQRGGTTYFAFCYPWSYAESQEQLEHLDETFKGCIDLRPQQVPESAIYYHRETACYSLDKRRIDLITITSCKDMCSEREPRLENLFPDKNVPRCHRFKGKKVYYVSSRVHPGETPASFVFNGFLEFALRENDARAQVLRDHYVIKLIPMLNPDGVYRGHYRTDQKGVNLNRLYLTPDYREHPSIYASRSLLLFYHHYYRKKDESIPQQNGDGDTIDSSENKEFPTEIDLSEEEHLPNGIKHHKSKDNNLLKMCFGKSKKDHIKETKFVAFQGDYTSIPKRESGIAFYVDLHGHASKRGCFIYGNHLENEEDQVDNLLFPKLIAVNSPHFDFNGCNFTERNMYLRDKRDGMSKEGSGRVAIFKTIGIIHSYTLECNYNTGRTVNCMSPAVPNGKATPPPPAGFPPKYTPEIFEGVGRAMAIAALDFYAINPWSRLKHSEFTTLDNLRNWMLRYVKGARGNPILPRKMTTRISMNGTVATTNGMGSSGSSSNGRNGNNTRFSGNSDSRRNPQPQAPSFKPATANPAQNKKLITASRNQLTPFKSMSSGNIQNMQAVNRFSNRQKTLIRVSVNNSARNARNSQTSTEQPLKQIKGAQKLRNGQEPAVTLSFTTAGSKTITSSGNQMDPPIHSNPSTFPTVIENLSSEMDEKLMVCLRALENPGFPNTFDNIVTPYTAPAFNIPMHSNMMKPLTPPIHQHAVPNHIRNNIIMQSLYNPQYILNDKDYIAGDSRTVKLLNEKQASFLLRKNILLGPNSLKSPSQTKQLPINPRLRESGFISPQVCRPPSMPSRGKSSLSIHSVSAQPSQSLSTTSDQLGPGNDIITPSTSFLSAGKLNTPIPTQHVAYTLNDVDRRLPLTVSRKPLNQSKDENSNYVFRTNSDLVQMTSKPPVVNFQGMNGLCPDNVTNGTVEKNGMPRIRKISRIRTPRKVSSSNGESDQNPKVKMNGETKYLKQSKRLLMGKNNIKLVTEPMLSGEAVRLSPRVQKLANEANEESFIESTIIPAKQEETSPQTTKTTSPTAINANLMMMNCLPNSMSPDL